MTQYLKFFSLVAMIVLVAPGVAFAEGGSAALYIPVGAGLAMGLAALGGTLGQGKAIAAGLDSIGRNPSAAGKITTPMYVGLAFVESLVIISFALGFLLKNLYA